MSRPTKAELVKKKCVADELFGTSFMVEIPYEASVPNEELATWGLTGFYEKEEMARELKNPIVVRTSIPYVVEKMNEGYEVALINAGDASVMYNIIRQHLANWKEVIKMHGSISDPPFEDLIALDNLAGKLYPLVPIESDEQKERRNKNRRIMSGLSDIAFIPNGDLMQETPIRKEPYDSYSSFFISQQYRIESYQ